MKKLFILLLSVVALVAFTSSAFALHGVKDMFEYVPQVVKAKKAMLEFSGHIRVRGETADTDFNEDNGTSNSYNTRARLAVKATVSPNTMGVIEFESANVGSDGGSNSDSIGWGSCAEGARGIYQQSNCKPFGIAVRQAYIAHQGTELTGMLTGFKVGHMLLALGDGIFFNHTQFGNDAIILWAQPNDNTEVSFITIKATEGSSTVASDDEDFYALTVATAAGGFNISADLTYVDADTSLRGTNANTDGLTLWNLGLRGSGTVGGGVNVSLDVELQSGEVSNAKSGGGDVDLSGYAVVAKASTKVGDITIRGQVGYGSGDDIDSSDDYEGFITSLSAGQRYTYLHDQKTMSAAQSIGAVGTAAGTASTSAGSNSGVANTLYVGIGAATNVNPDVKVEGDVYWIQAAEKWSNASGLNDDDVGVEVDGKITYQIDTNLVWYVEAGYLFAGDFYKNSAGAKLKADGNPDDAYSVRHGIVLTF